MPVLLRLPRSWLSFCRLVAEKSREWRKSTLCSPSLFQSLSHLLFSGCSAFVLVSSVPTLSSTNLKMKQKPKPHWSNDGKTSVVGVTKMQLSGCAEVAAMQSAHLYNTSQPSNCTVMLPEAVGSLLDPYWQEAGRCYILPPEPERCGEQACVRVLPIGFGRSISQAEYLGSDNGWMPEVITCLGSFDSPLGFSTAEENVFGKETFAMVELVSLLKETSIPWCRILIRAELWTYFQCAA